MPFYQCGSFFGKKWGWIGSFSVGRYKTGFGLARVTTLSLPDLGIKMNHERLPF